MAHSIVRYARNSAALLLAAIPFCICASAQNDAHARAVALLKKMTMEEKIGQMNQASGDSKVGGPDTSSPDKLIPQGKVGSVLWQHDTAVLNRLQHLAVDKSRLHIPLLTGYDVIHGYRTTFPVPLAMASSWDPSVEEQAQRWAASDARAAGINLIFTPMVDIARDARWGRIVEGAGEDPYLGSAMAAAQVRGLQGETIGPDSALACVKHFAGYGAADGGRDYDSSYVPEELMQNVYLLPFHAAVKAGAASIMSAYMDLNDVPASGNRWLLTDVLRDQFGFKGFVLSDAFAVASLVKHGYAEDPSDAAYKAVTAGVNMDMGSQTYIKNLPALVRAGKASEQQIDAMVLPILELKYKLGLFENPYVDASKVEAMLSRPQGRTLARKLAARSMVLLRNQDHTLPLNANVKSIAVIGPLADSAADIEGGWTVEGMLDGKQASNPVTILQGLKNRLGPSAKITYVAGPALGRDFRNFFDEMKHVPSYMPPTAEQTAASLQQVKLAAASADLVIAVLGETSSMSSEAASRATLTLPGIQQQMLEAAAAGGKPVVLVLENGRPLDIRWASEHVPAILEAWYPGTEGGNAVADVLFGDVDPGGKLPLSWPRAAGQEPLYYNHNLTQDHEDDPKFTSRYWDLSSKPLYPFGYGLSYTTFRFANLKLSAQSIPTSGSLTVTADVINSGTAAGDAVAQLYIHQRYGSASRPVRQLEGFRRLALKPGETQTVTFTLGPDELSFWSPQTRQRAVETSTFDVWLGEDSTAPLHAEFATK